MGAKFNVFKLVIYLVAALWALSLVSRLWTKVNAPKEFEAPKVFNHLSVLQ